MPPNARLPRLVLGLALLGALLTTAGGAPAETAKAPLAELREHFTVGGKPVPPRIFTDFGDGDLADSDDIWLTVNLLSATDSNRYYDEIKTHDTWYKQIRHDDKSGLDEESSYRYIGMTQNKLLIVVSSFSGGGTGVFYTLHLLDAAIVPGFDNDGKTYDRLALTNLRSLALGDRWVGSVTIKGNRVTIVSAPNQATNPDSKDKITSFEARRP